MKIGIISLFPEMFEALSYGIIRRAQEQQHIVLSHFNPRDFAKDKHRTVDDRPYGGGPGMVMAVQPLRDAIARAKQTIGQSAPVIYLSPQGKCFDQAKAYELAELPNVIFVAGRYEGIDERLIELSIDQELSIGDYILSGGELAAMVVIDAITRLQKGVLGHECSAEQDSFSDGLLEYPHYTRPEEIDGLKVPDVLLSGDHSAIARWRQQQALERTAKRRPDLLAKLKSTEDIEK